MADRGVGTVEGGGTPTLSATLRAVPDGPPMVGMEALSEAARSATLSANLAGATRLEVAQRLVAEFEARAEAEAERERTGGLGPRPKWAGLDPRARARDHLAAACQLSCWHARRLVTAGVQIHTRLPRLLSQVGRGLVPEELAIDIACRLAAVPDEIVSAVEAEVMVRFANDLAGGDRPSRSRVESVIDDEVERRDRAGAEAAAEKAKAERTVRFRRRRNGMASMWALLPAAEAELIRLRLQTDVESAVRAGAEGTREQLRADALASLAAYTPTREPEVVDGIEIAEAEPDSELTRPTIGNAAAAGGQPIRINVITAATRGVPDRVEFVRGAYASLDWLCAELLSGEDARVRFQLVDPVPGAMDTTEQSLRYVLSAGLAERIRLRDGTCRHPGCEVAAEDCDIDHILAFDRDNPHLGGPTMEWNLVCLCRKHHREKTFGGSVYRPGALGELIITTESGHSHRTRPTGPLARAREGIQDRVGEIMVDRMISPDGYIINPPGSWSWPRGKPA